MEQKVIDLSHYFSLFLWLSTYLPTYLSIYRSIYLSFYRSIYLSIFVSIYLSLSFIRLAVYLSICGAVSLSVM